MSGVRIETNRNDVESKSSRLVSSASARDSLAIGADSRCGTNRAMDITHLLKNGGSLQGEISVNVSFKRSERSSERDLLVVIDF